MLRWLAYILAAILVGIAVIVLYAASADLGRFKGRAESIASASLGRDLRIEGDLSLRLGRTVRLRANDVVIRNTPWARGPHILRAAEVSVDLELWSLLRGPVRIERVELQNADLRLQEDIDGRRNWDFEGLEANTEQPASKPPGLPTIARLALRDTRIKVAAPYLTGETEIVIAAAGFGSRDSLLEIEATAEINKVPLRIEAEISPLSRLASLRDLAIQADAVLGEITVRMRADVVDLRSLAVSSANIEVNGPDAAYLSRVLKLPEITSGPMKAAATLLPDPDRSEFKASGQFGEYRVTADGWFEDLLGQGGFDARFELAGPDLAVLGERLAISNLPPEPFAAIGRILADASRINVEDAEIQIGDRNFRGQGGFTRLNDGRKKIDLLARFESTSLRLAAVTGHDWATDKVEIDFDLEGTNAREPGGGLRLDMLPPLPFAISGKGTYATRSLMLDEALVRVDEMGDLGGSVAFSNDDRPTIDAHLQSTGLILPRRGESSEARGIAIEDGRLIPDLNIPFELLAVLDANVDIALDSLRSPLTAGASVRVQAQLRDSRLNISSFETDGKRGRLQGSLIAEPTADAYEVTLNVNGQELYVAPPDEPADSLAARPAYELAAELQASGANVRHLANSLTGTVRLTAGAGTIPRRGGRLSTLFLEDFVSRTFAAINPLIEERDSMELNCLVLRMDIDGGTMKGDPLLALQTRELNLLARGSIDLRDEALNLDFAAQPRRGLGISIGDVVNPFTRVGGTLAAPQIVADAKSGIIETGLGIATGGLWPLAKKLGGRFLGGSPCEKVLETGSDRDASTR